MKNFWPKPWKLIALWCTFSKISWVRSEKRGFVLWRLLCPSARLQPVSQQLGMGCGFIHLNTTAAFKSWAGDCEQGKWSDSAKSELCSSLRCGEEASTFPIASSSLVAHHSSFLLPACCFFVQDEFLLWCSLILTLYLQKHWVVSSSLVLRELLCSLRKCWDFTFCVIWCYTRNQNLW